MWDAGGTEVRANPVPESRPKRPLHTGKIRHSRTTNSMTCRVKCNFSQKNCIPPLANFAG